METLTSKEELLKIKLIDFYKNRENLHVLLPIILQQTKISLRSLDWFVTNYCKKYNINYPLTKNDENKIYFPFKSYKSQLKAYSKKFCDPFCRRERVIFDYENDTIINFNSNVKLGHKNYIITTIGQLNFFRFAIQDNIINYALENITEIEQDMNSTLKNRETEKKNGDSSSKNGDKFLEVKNIKRKELSVPGNKSVHITRISATIKFV
jgi:hypothetical protein